ncbi:YaaC family protein [Methylobacterium sp. 285MFTsu5.1]|uniref:YaaC family protein n=1 Tax=Methylobacterium sp. 285MFTsu5.1 TaxID=1172187 RepID=UPI001319D5B6|nr:YaaC family protein [Methylobacterium sp. 285MFTsu5.1]
MPIERLKIGAKAIGLHKAIVGPRFTERNVLTNTPWTFVDLWLKREKHANAVLFWEQARQFYDASINLPMQSSPLLLYYSFMNAAKALLEVKGIQYQPHHGVRENPPGQPRRQIALSTLEVRIKQTGIVPSLSAHFGELEASRVHSMEDIFYNLPYVHRTFCLSYKSKKDMFFPLRDCEYVRDSDNGQVYFRAKIGSDWSRQPLEAYFPHAIVPDPAENNGIRSRNHVVFAAANAASAQEIGALASLHQNLRTDLYYINGAQTLWYIKTTGRNRLDRRTPTLTLAAMHRLSEICRYRPVELMAFMNGQRNWLLNEFVTMSPVQYFDEIASEITGHQFLIPNVRGPS